SRQCPPQSDSIFPVQVQRRDGCSAGLRRACQIESLPDEVGIPAVISGVEKRNDRLRYRIDPREIRSLLAIAFRARQREVLQTVILPMLRRKDVIHVEAGGIAVLGQVAVLAPIAGSLDDEGPSRGVDQSSRRWLPLQG